MINFEKIKNHLFLYVKEIIEKKRKNKLVEFFIYIVSFFYRFLVFLKNFCYDFKIFKPKKVKSIVISIGNIDSGGTGKTPFAIFLAKKLISDKKVAIITRGYKSKYENKSLYVNKDSDFDVFEIGDEPFIFKNRIKDISIFIGKDKLKSARWASDLNYDILLIDDGFQYRKLKKDLEIVIINSKTSLEKSNCLPKGFLREHPKNLKRADFIVINNSKGKDKDLETEIKKYKKCPIIYTKPYLSRILNFSKKEIHIKENTKVAAFCAIANPRYFFNTIQSNGLKIVNKLILLDHQPISAIKLKSFVEDSLKKNAEFIITTEKDFVKLNLNMQSVIPIVYLEIILKIIANNHHKETMVENIYNLVNN